MSLATKPSSRARTRRRSPSAPAEIRDGRKERAYAVSMYSWTLRTREPSSSIIHAYRLWYSLPSRMVPSAWVSAATRSPDANSVPTVTFGSPGSNRPRTGARNSSMIASRPTVNRSPGSGTHHLPRSRRDGALGASPRGHRRSTRRRSAARHRNHAPRPRSSRFEDDHRRLGRPPDRIRVEPRIDRDPALPQPITLLPRRTACAHRARLLVRAIE